MSRIVELRIVDVDSRSHPESIPVSIVMPKAVRHSRQNTRRSNNIAPTHEDDHTRIPCMIYEITIQYQMKRSSSSQLDRVEDVRMIEPSIRNQISAVHALVIPSSRWKRSINIGTKRRLHASADNKEMWTAVPIATTKGTGKPFFRLAKLSGEARALNRYDLRRYSGDNSPSRGLNFWTLQRNSVKQ